MSKEWYFVRKLRPHERPESPARFEVQVLDDDGLAVAVGYFSEETDVLVVGDREIPRPVLEAGKRRGEGQGDYVGPDGKSLPPF